MALIEKQKEGREDGGFTRTLGDKKLGGLISQVHATSISAGTELEKLICEKHTLVMTEADFSAFVNKKLANGTYLIPKKVIKSTIKTLIGSKSEPDFLVIVIGSSKAYVVEVKDGDAFDTKKSAGEISSCREFAMSFAQYLVKNGINYTVEVRVCCFNQKTKEAVVSGLKSEISKSEAWTGSEFCKVLGICYEEIIKQRKIHQERNFNYFIERLLAIDKVSSAILKYYSDSKTSE